MFCSVLLIKCTLNIFLFNFLFTLNLDYCTRFYDVKKRMNKKKNNTTQLLLHTSWYDSNNNNFILPFYFANNSYVYMYALYRVYMCVCVCVCVMTICNYNHLTISFNLVISPVTDTNQMILHFLSIKCEMFRHVTVILYSFISFIPYGTFSILYFSFLLMGWICDLTSRFIISTKDRYKRQHFN